MSACVRGSIATAIVSFLLPNFIFPKNTKFINDEPNTANAPIAIGSPVNPNIAVKAIELKGAVATTVTIPPSIIPIIIGLAVDVAVITPPIFCRVVSTSGFEIAAIPLTSGAPRTIITIKSRPAGIFFSKNFITNEPR